MPYIKLPVHMLDIVTTCLDKAEFSDEAYGSAIATAKRKAAKEAYEFVMEARVLPDNAQTLGGTYNEATN